MGSATQAKLVESAFGVDFAAMISGSGGFFEARAADGLRATVEALYPANDYGAPDFRDADMVSRTFEYWRALPVRQRRLLMSLFALVELAAVLLVPGFRRFSKIPVDRREQAVRNFRRSRFLPLRLLGDALKAATTVIYMSHPSVLKYVGMYSACDRPMDPMPVTVRRDAFARMGTGL